MDDKIDLQNQVLAKLGQDGQIDNTEQFEQDTGMDHMRLEAILKGLDVDRYIELQPIKRKEIRLTEEGEEWLEKGTPEFRVWELLEVDKETDKKAFLEEHKIEIDKHVIAKLKTNGWAEMGKTWVKKIDGVQAEDTGKVILEEMKSKPRYEDHDEKRIKEFKNRKFIKFASITSYKVTKGEEFRPQFVELEAEMTMDLMKDDAYKNMEFKKFNVNALGAEIEGGHLHPLLKVRTLFREIFMEMGFEEMPTSQYVESPFCIIQIEFYNKIT